MYSGSAVTGPFPSLNRPRYAVVISHYLSGEE